MSGLVQVRRDRGREFKILGAATLRLREPNDVRTNGAERRLVLESLRERNMKQHLAKSMVTYSARANF